MPDFVPHMKTQGQDVRDCMHTHRGKIIWQYMCLQRCYKPHSTYKHIVTWICACCRHQIKQHAQPHKPSNTCIASHRTIHNLSAHKYAQSIKMPSHMDKYDMPV